ncbi:putative ABC transporter ATP-binding protein YvfR [Pseudolycoriella hygida]|uniref:ABC transporter ATP-binding protein YvfR n=1 Tax=Pseudolycoriella hygida TaxID=35572 RepID=A0A9Q0MQ07_9DIPT|nr:putative ABC transporter ATP-binding protein YvfR [Pseudolycoriella hygida]
MKDYINDFLFIDFFRSIKHQISSEPGSRRRDSPIHGRKGSSPKKSKETSSYHYTSTCSLAAIRNHHLAVLPRETQFKRFPIQIEGGTMSKMNSKNIFVPQFEEREVAIRVVDLYKRYRNVYQSKTVLNGFNLVCQAGIMYILYGARKSGKTAVVKSILKMESFSRGAVAIFNKSVKQALGTIGYMPQEVGLDPFLSVIETITYFASLQKLDPFECFKDFRSLQSPMTVCEYCTLVIDLKEEQKRVLSFFLAIMSSPKLVILDQPLAGCDPLYRHFFWQKLRSMVNEGTTVFMTCSDEIDVKYADVFAYLRDGQIIVEDSTEDLMKRYNMTNFNDLVLAITIAQVKQFAFEEEAKKNELDKKVSITSGGFSLTHFTLNDSEEVTPRETIMLSGSFSESFIMDKRIPSSLNEIMSQLWILAKWQLVVSLRQLFKIILHFLLPTLCVLFYGYAVGNNMSEVDLGIVFCGNQADCFKIDPPALCHFEQRISKKYLTKKYYNSYEEAYDDGKKGELNAILLLNIASNVTAEEYEEHGCKSSALNTTNIVLELLSSSKLVRTHIVDQLSRAYSLDESVDDPIISQHSRQKIRFEKCLSECEATAFVTKLNYHKSDKYESDVMNLMWGAIATITHFSGALLGALPLCIQNQNGVIDRMKIMEVTHMQLQLVHWCTRTFFILVQNLLLLISAIAFLEIDFFSYGFFCGWFTVALQSLCGFSFGILLFGIIKRQVPIILSLIVIEIVIASLSGFLWSYHGLSQFFQKLTIVLPHHAVSKLLFNVIVQGVSVIHNNNWIGILSPLFWMISSFGIYCVLIETNK